MTTGISYVIGAGRPIPDTTPAEYRPGVCNIGPAEIAKRRRGGHVGVIAAVVLFVVLVVIAAIVPL